MQTLEKTKTPQGQIVGQRTENRHGEVMFKLFKFY